MKYFLALILFLSINDASGQSADSVTKIILIYGRSHNSWGDPGVYGKSERIEITSFNRKSFKITRHIVFTYSAGTDGNTFSKDSTIVHSRDYTLVSKEKINNLLVQLHTNKDNFNAAFIIPYLKRPPQRIIDSINAQVDSSFFDKDFKNERRSASKKIRRFDKLDSFLYNRKPDPKFLRVVVSDASDYLTILINGNGETERYESSLFTLFGQPFFKEAKASNPLVDEIPFVNLEINTSLVAILPKSSLLKETIDLNTITKEYIRWYMDKQLWTK